MFKQLSPVFRITFCSFFLFALLFAASAATPASAHGPKGGSLLDLPRCNARLTTCQPPVEEELTAQQEAAPTDFDHHTCMDGLGFGRSCLLDGPFEYLTIPTEFVERALPQLDPIGFTPCVDGMADRFPCQNVDYA